MKNVIKTFILCLVLSISLPAITNASIVLCVNGLNGNNNPCSTPIIQTPVLQPIAHPNPILHTNPPVITPKPKKVPKPVVPKSKPAPVAIKNTDTVKSNDEVCADTFGIGWKWDGTKNDKGSLGCGCKDTYTLNNKEECVLVPVKALAPSTIVEKPPVLVKTTPSEIKKILQPKKIQKEVKEIIPKPIVVELKPIIPPQETKPQSFWGKLRGWLGF